MKDNLEQILKSCLRNERFGQRCLYERYYSFGLNTCLRYAKNREEAREMLNDGFYKVFKYLHKYDLKLPFEPWLKRLLINAAIDYFHKYRNKQDIVELQAKHTADLITTPSDQLNYEALLNVIQGLPRAYRMVFNLYEIEGFKHHEIAEKLNISVGTSKSNLARAKTKLRQLLAVQDLKKSENV